MGASAPCGRSAGRHSPKMNAGPSITKTSGRPLSLVDALPPFPEGWYFVANRESILREKLIEKTWMGEEIVVWCDAEGRIRVSDAVCPHLGSHLGPTVGGKVRDCATDSIRNLRQRNTDHVCELTDVAPQRPGQTGAKASIQLMTVVRGTPRPRQGVRRPPLRVCRPVFCCADGSPSKRVQAASVLRS